VSDFSRTLRTATDAEGISALLERAADRASYPDRIRLMQLSERYRDYADALRSVVMPEEVPEAEQPRML